MEHERSPSDWIVHTLSEAIAKHDRKRGSERCLIGAAAPPNCDEHALTAICPNVRDGQEASRRTAQLLWVLSSKGTIH